MRKFLIAGAATLTALCGTGQATAQVYGGGQMHRGTMPGGSQVYRGQVYRGQSRAYPIQQHTGGRWGQSINGRWYAGERAPGGWSAYRRPTRGWTLPHYWNGANYYISDYATFGLSRPPYGYTWSRYYDDAVLIDGRGRVYDSVSGLDWDGYSGGYYAGYDQQPGYPQPYPQDGYYGRGYSGDDYAYAQGGSGGVVYAPYREVVQPTGHYYAPATTTTVTSGAPTVTTTTTTTEYITEYAAPARRTYKSPRRTWRPVVRQCSCRCVCR